MILQVESVAEVVVKEVRVSTTDVSPVVDRGLIEQLVSSVVPVRRASRSTARVGCSRS